MSNLPASVVVPARNAAHWLGECLESTGCQHPHQVMLIDGCPTDNTVQTASSFGAPDTSEEGAGLPSGGFDGLQIGLQVGLQIGLVGEPGGPGHGGSAPAWRTSFLLTLAAGTVLMLAGPFLLSLLGPRYASAWVLVPLLVPGLLAGCLIQVYYGLCRAQGRLGESTAVAVMAAGRRLFMLTR